jgi:hypothetical protein
VVSAPSHEKEVPVQKAFPVGWESNVSSLWQRDPPDESPNLPILSADPHHPQEPVPPSAPLNPVLTTLVDPQHVDVDTHHHNPTPVPPFRPNQAWAQYKAWHSIDAMHADGSWNATSTRQYAVVPYWCPERAGNILHNALNSVLWAVLHNRTILWRYVTNNAQQVRNAEDLCQSILPRAEWMPTWDVTQPRLGLPEPVPVPNMVDTYAHDRAHPVVLFPQLPDIEKERPDIRRVDWADHPWRRETYNDPAYIEQTLPPPQRAIASDLVAEGVPFLMGMLLREIFRFPLDVTEFRPNVDDEQQQQQAVSVALHSRHIVDADDGSYVAAEKTCLAQMLPTLPRSNGTDPIATPCRVYLMSDRPLTLSLLSDWLRERGCTPIVAAHDDASPNAIVEEHGPYSGKGFIEDLTVASLARTGTVGNRHRSSYMLLEELVAYDRVHEAWIQAGRPASWSDPAAPGKPGPLQFCALPHQGVQGYDYGPGTPNFVRPMYLEPLIPDATVDTYVTQHSATALHAESLETLKTRRYAVAHYSCPVEAGTRLHHFMNAVVWSIASNRTLLWKYNDDRNSVRDCQKILGRLSWLPAYNEWAPKLQLPPPVDLLVGSTETATSVIPRSPTNFSWEEASQLEDFPVVVFPSLTGRIPRDWVPYRTLLATSTQQSTLDRLYDLGADVLYGTVLYKSFQYSRIVRMAAFNIPKDTPGAVSIALHRRHRVGEPVDDVATKEVACLDQMIPRNSSDLVSCRVMVASDQTETAQNVQAWLSVHRPGCTIVVPPLPEDGMAVSPAQYFFQAMNVLASRVTSGFIGHGQHPLSHLVREQLEYRRHHNIWAAGRVPPVFGELPTCDLDTIGRTDPITTA